MAPILSGILIATCVVLSTGLVPAPDPGGTAKRVGDQILLHQEQFLFWGYGGALIFDGLYQCNATFGLQFASSLDKHLDNYETDKESFGYKLLHNETIPWSGAVGDTLGLFPIAFIDRAVLESPSTRGYNNSTDLYLAETVARKYIVPFPRRLPDGTFSRDTGGSWAGETDGNHTFVWVDDMYMGLTLLARLAVILNETSFAQEVARQELTFSEHLQGEDGLFYHGYNDLDKHHSCCKWGRGNGWAMMSHIEVLQALKHFPELREEMEKIQLVLEKHSKAIAKYQSDDGRFHQLVNETWTFLETSSTAMFITSLVRGVVNNWLEYDDYKDVIEKAWKGLQSAITANGTVTGVCSGTGIEPNANDYEGRPTSYLNSANGGLGSVLYAAVDMDKFYKFMM
jgi:rhamnogalacturonyl hydrolase YesR